MVPHVFASDDLESSDTRPRDATVSVCSVCCGPNAVGGEPVKGDRHQPFLCFMGWHTTKRDAVEEQYNSVNVLRCASGPGGKCQRTLMKHHAHYQHLFDDRVKAQPGRQRRSHETLEGKMRIGVPKLFQHDFDYTGGEISEEDAEDQVQGKTTVALQA